MDIIEELKKRKKKVGEYRPFWRFKDGERDGQIVKGNPVFVGRLLGWHIDPRDREGKRKLYDVVTLEGEEYTLPSYAALNRALENVKEGSYLYIEYVGEGKPGRGGKKPLLFEVATMTEEEVAMLKEKTAEVAPKPAKKSPEEMREKGKNFLSTLLDYYGELSVDKAREALMNAGVTIPLEELCSELGLKIQEGKIRR